MLVYGNAAMDFGRAALGGFGGLAIFPGGPEFQGGDSYNIFFDDGTSRWAQGAQAYNLTWTRPSSAVLSGIAKVWSSIDASGSMADAAFKESLQARMAPIVKSIDQLAGTHDIFGYNQSVTTQLVARMNDLKRLLQEGARYKLQPEAVEVVIPPSKQPSSVAAQAATAVIQAASGGGGGVVYLPAPEDDSPGWILPVAIGGGVLLVGGLIFMLTRKKKSSMGRYSKRRRIRR